ncbi:MAG TPA: hypothetical protein VNU45_18040 [Rummeliibacillus sp.]|nr:hypothetical protein [Rummeliibacillus sp.]
MIPTIYGFDIIKTPNGFGVTTLYDLFNLNKPTILRELPNWNDAVEHKKLCFKFAIQEYEWLKARGLSFPCND